MTIHKEGFRTIGLSSVVALLLIIVVNYFFPVQTPVHYLFYLALVVVYGLIVRFFRLPAREMVQNEQQLISAADGTVVVIEEIEENECFNQSMRQVSVFMSPLNVHVNWFPMAGEVCYARYQDGKHLLARKPKASMENEMCVTGMTGIKDRKVLIRQIAGAMARRVVCYARKGHQVQQGQQVGFIKFGSRVDLVIPLSAEINVEIGQKVTGGKTVIATFKD